MLETPSYHSQGCYGWPQLSRRVERSGFGFPRAGDLLAGQEHLRKKEEVLGAQQGISVCPGIFQRVGTAQSVKMVVKHLLISRWSGCGKWELLWKIPNLQVLIFPL